MAVSSIVDHHAAVHGKAALPLYASMFALLLNTGLNYLLIFGKWNFSQMGVEGAALANSQPRRPYHVLSSFCFYCRQEKTRALPSVAGHRTEDQKQYQKQYFTILCPLLVCEFLWSLGKMSIQQSMEISEPMHARR